MPRSASRDRCGWPPVPGSSYEAAQPRPFARPVHGTYVGVGRPFTAEPMIEPIPRGLSRPERFLAQRRARLERILGRWLPAPPPSAIAPERRRFLLEEAEELYVNELAWEQITDEEMAGGSQLVELTFPGFLAFIEGLLVTGVPPDSPAPATPRPDVVEAALLFLAGRCMELEDAAEPGTRVEGELTRRLMDLVLHRLHRLRPEEIDRLEIARLAGDE